MAIGFTPRHTESVGIESYSAEHFLALAFEALKKMGWELNYISAAGFIAATNNGIMKWNAEIRLKIDSLEAHVTSESSGSDMIDWGKNKKNVHQFINTLNQLKTSLTPDQLQEVYDELKPHFTEKEEDILILPPQSAAEKAKDLLSIFKPVQGYFITPILLNLNIALFIAMVFTGVNILSPDNESLLLWGANFRPATLNGEWWRIITSCFLHIGFVHLLFNMYALLYIGILLEPMLGSRRFLTAYLLTGISASTSSLWWNNLTISAGASGAIFGMYGVFIALITTNLFNKEQRGSLLSSMGVFVGYNLLFGLTVGGIDNSAHIGGLLSGIIIGYCMYPGLLHTTSKKLQMAISAALIALIVSGSVYVYSNINNDIGIYEKKMEEFSALENEAIAIFGNANSMTEDQQVDFLKHVGIHNWKKNIALIVEIETLELPDYIHKRNLDLIRYCELRIKSYELLGRSISERTDKYNAGIDEYNMDIDSLLKKLNNGM